MKMEEIKVSSNQEYRCPKCYSAVFFQHYDINNQFDMIYFCYTCGVFYFVKSKEITPKQKKEI